MRRPGFCLSLLFPLFYLHSQSTRSVPAVLEGDVVNAATNAPVSGARLRLNLANDAVYAKADRDGHFVFASLTPGSFQLTVESPGFLQQQTSVDLTVPRPVGTAGVLRGVISYGNALPPPKVTKTVDEDGTVRVKASVPMVASAVITGKVTDPYGLPLKGSAIEVLTKQPVRQGPAGAAGVQFSASSPNPASGVVRKTSTQTDDRGEYRIANLAPGTYWVVANKGNSLPATWEGSARITYFPGATSLDGAKPLDLAAGQVIRADIQIVKVSGIRMAGKLIGPPGVSGVTVSQPGAGPQTALYTNVALVPQGSVLLNANGPFTTGQDSFEFKDVMPGKYTLLALTRDAASDPTGRDQKAVAGLMREIEVGQQDMPGFDLVLEPLRDLTGEVVFGEGCKAAPIEIRTSNYGPIGGPQVKAVSGPDGKFVLTALPPGRTQISATWQGSPGPAARIASVRLGDRDVLANGMDAPYSGKDTLRIAVECVVSGRRQ